MGLFDIFRKPGKLGGLAVPASVGIVTPYESAQLQRIAWAEHFNGELGDVNRNAAMSIPAIARGRAILVGIVAGLPLRELEDEADLSTAWLYTTRGAVSPWHRMAWTLDDLIFYGWSLWAVERDTSGQINDAARVPFEYWELDAQTGAILVNGKPANAAEVILIPGPFEGLLAAGATTITGARALERSWIGRAQNPIPLLVIQQVTDDEIDDDEIDEMVEAFAEARNSPNGAVGFADHRVKLEAIGTVSTDLFEKGRNASVLDVARLMNLPAALLDGSQSTATLTYSTQEGKRSEFLDYSLGYWIAPIEARLSMDDVCASGRRIRFDKTELTVTETAPLSTPTED